MTKLIVLVALLAACSKQESQGTAGSGTAGSGSARPAAVTQAMADTFEAYVAAFEKLVAAIDATHGDCKAAVAAVDRSRTEVAVLAPRGEALREAMKSAKGDAAAGAWFSDTFGPRMQAAAGKLGTAGAPCESDPAFHAAMNAAMADYPMMRRKPD